ncbi:calpain-5-like, partial [Brachionus plicatilis]
QNYLKIKSECQKSSTLFTDPLFERTSQSLYPTRRGPMNIKWMRPVEICKLNGQIAKFVEDTANANDLDQGYLGNCWFIAGCAAITFMPELFDKVVPKNQTCHGSGYSGIFHFRFWIYGVWHDVVVDDYLPVWQHSNQLVFCSNREEPNEFWAALLEKAYAKVCGSYENLEGGFTTDALIDMSGGIEESLFLDKKNSGVK